MMFSQLLLDLPSIIIHSQNYAGHQQVSRRNLRFGAVVFLLLSSALSSQAVSLDKRSNLQNASGSSFVWTIQDTYAGETFFECVLIMLSLLL